jgi:hypothetical protein
MNVYLEHGSYYYRVHGKPRVRLGRDRKSALEKLKSFGVNPPRMHVDHLSVVFANARKNAASRGLSFELTRGDLDRMWLRSGGKCELTRIPFDLIKPTLSHRRPLAPSIDRIDGTKGYSAQNCRLVLVALNLALNEFGEEVFARIASRYLSRRRAANERRKQAFLTRDLCK